MSHQILNLASMGLDTLCSLDQEVVSHLKNVNVASYNYTVDLSCNQLTSLVISASEKSTESTLLRNLLADKSLVSDCPDSILLQQSAEKVNSLLRFTREIRVLIAQKNRLTSVADFNTTWPSLIVLDLCGNLIGDEGSVTCSNLLSLLRISTLDTLILADNSITRVTLTPVSETEIAADSSLRRSERPRSTGGLISPLLQEPRSVLWTALRVLDLSRNKLSKLPVLYACVNLETLDLSGNNLVSLEGLSRAFVIADNENHSRVSSSRVSSSCRAVYAGGSLAVAGAQFPPLKRLFLHNNALGNFFPGFLELAALAETIEELTVDKNPFLDAIYFSHRIFLFWYIPRLGTIDGSPASTYEGDAVLQLFMAPAETSVPAADARAGSAQPPRELSSSLLALLQRGNESALEGYLERECKVRMRRRSAASIEGSFARVRACSIEPAVRPTPSRNSSFCAGAEHSPVGHTVPCREGPSHGCGYFAEGVPLARSFEQLGDMSAIAKDGGAADRDILVSVEERINRLTLVVDTLRRVDIGVTRTRAARIIQRVYRAHRVRSNLCFIFSPSELWRLARVKDRFRLRCAGMDVRKRDSEDNSSQFDAQRTFVAHEDALKQLNDSVSVIRDILENSLIPMVMRTRLRAAVTIQRYYRGYRARAVFKVLHQRYLKFVNQNTEIIGNIVKIQAAVRMFITRRKYRRQIEQGLEIYRLRRRVEEQDSRLQKLEEIICKMSLANG